MMLRPMHTVTASKRTAVITDGPTLVKGARFFTVTHAAVEYTWRNEAWRMTHIDFSGPVVKKDGQTGAVQTTRTYWSSGEYPEWVRKIVAQLTPSGSPYTDDSRFEVRNPAQEA